MSSTLLFDSCLFTIIEMMFYIFAEIVSSSDSLSTTPSLSIVSNETVSNSISSSSRTAHILTKSASDTVTYESPKNNHTVVSTMTSPSITPVLQKFTNVTNHMDNSMSTTPLSGSTSSITVTDFINVTQHNHNAGASSPSTTSTTDDYVKVSTSLVQSKPLISGTAYKSMNGPNNVTSIKDSAKRNRVNYNTVNNLYNSGTSHINMEQTNGSTSSTVGESLPAGKLNSNLPLKECATILGSQHIDSTITADNGASSVQQVNENHTAVLAGAPSRDKSEVKHGMITVGYTLNDNCYTSPYILSSLNKLGGLHKLTKTPLVDKINSLSDDIMNRTVVSKLNNKISTSLESNNSEKVQNINGVLTSLDLSTKSFDILSRNGNHLDLISAFPNQPKTCTHNKLFSDHSLDDSFFTEYKSSHTQLDKNNFGPVSVNTSTISTAHVPYINKTKLSGLCKEPQGMVITTNSIENRDISSNADNLKGNYIYIYNHGHLIMLVFFLCLQ